MRLRQLATASNQSAINITEVTTLAVADGRGPDAWWETKSFLWGALSNNDYKSATTKTAAEQ